MRHLIPWMTLVGKYSYTSLNEMSETDRGYSEIVERSR